ncbi:long-chain fatty acid--CoA ligase [Blastococcus sp. CT_GayMR19]|uniref:AMP-binding protein n=1 Tax=Blastococcus sp. CT_GayMR19 TaxID=2559608 RepID=UPI001073A46A|nr:AMP-binding protein [Blastococcus sp. CT_GayMR19]TFV76105.1 long-chain fatty acid--CoA ligase [Blastococcus sp. CT_GayMR19]
MSSAPNFATGRGDAIRDRSLTVTHEQLVSDAFGLRTHVPFGAAVALRGRRARTVAAAVLALEGWASRVDLLGPVEDTPEDADRVLVDDTLVSDQTTPASATVVSERPATETPTVWRLFTSGTTGAPKAIDHTLASLTRTVQRARGDAGMRRTWGLVYEPTRLAGMQVLLQSLSNGDLLLDAASDEPLPERLRWLAEQRVDSLSATPTLWRQVLQSADPASLPLRQITLGGEIADQLVLNALARTFPDARITHIFASTETGAAFAVNDGREGFPLSYLSEPPRGVHLEVRDGILFVEAPGTSAAGPDGFASTGDLVEVTDDRVIFLGRASGVVNVGGVKVAPEQVEAVLRAHPDVLDAVVRSRRNAFSGSILVADVVVTPDASREALSARLRAHVAAQLPSAHVPASVKVVPELSTSVTGKAGR